METKARDVLWGCFAGIQTLHGLGMLSSRGWMLEFHGLYQDVLVVQTLSAHFSVIDSAHKIPGVDISAGAHGALALSCASV